jgi:hypothetical protein
MLSMHLWIIQQRRGRLLSWQDLAQDLGIAFEQGIDGLSHLASHASDLHHDYGTLQEVTLRSLRKEARVSRKESTNT